MKCKSLICSKRAVPGSPYCSYQCAPGTRLNPPIVKVYPMSYNSGKSGKAHATKSVQASKSPA
jgi:hypothetical protein